MNGNGILLGPYWFDGIVYNGGYLGILKNFILPQLQDFYNTEW